MGSLSLSASRGLRFLEPPESQASTHALLWVLSRVEHFRWNFLDAEEMNERIRGHLGMLRGVLA